MDWRLLLTTFGLIFLAELGDKTQLATLSFACEGNSFWAVFAGSSLALVTSSLLATVLGGMLTRILPLRWVHLSAGLVFILIGVLVVIRTLRSG